MENITELPPMEKSPSVLGQRMLSARTRLLVGGSGVGAFLFTVTYLLEGITRPGYDGWQQAISALSLGPGGWVQQINFVVFGVLMLLSAFGWYYVLTPGRAAIWFSLFQGISGLGLIGAGLFSMDPPPGYPPGAAPTTPTVHGTLHMYCADVIILAFGCFTLAAHFARVPRGRGWAIYSAVSGALILFFWARFVGNATGPVAGLVERLSAGAHALWLCALVATLLVHNRHAAVPMKA